MSHLMIDLETMGTTVGAPIVQIGACEFQPSTGVVGATFSAHVLLEGQPGIDGSTVLWWLKQSQEARGALLRGQDAAPTLKGALLDLGTWCNRVFRGQPEGVWSHGATFDIPMLEHAFKSHGLEAPWRYYTARDTRTLFWLAGTSVDRSGGVHHSAVDDAVAQARAVGQAMQSLGKRAA